MTTQRACRLSDVFYLQADIEDRITCRVSTRAGCSLSDAFASKIENTGGRKWFNYLVLVKQTRVYIEWEMNVTCVRGHRLLILNKMDRIPKPLLGAHHFLVHPDTIAIAAAAYSDNDYYYILRPSLQTPGSYALAITTPSEPNGSSYLRHVKIGYDPESEAYSLCSKEFDELEALIDFFKSTPIKVQHGPRILLKYPVPIDLKLEEDCKRRFRLTRSGSGAEDKSPDADTVSLWSVNSITLTPNCTPSMYTCDSDDERPSWLTSSLSPDSKTNRISRSSTVISLTDDKDDDVDTDVVMRGLSTSSTGTTTSSGSGGEKSDLSARFTIAQKLMQNVGKSLLKDRPKSELIIRRERSSLDAAVAPRSKTCVDRPVVQAEEEVEECYVDMRCVTQTRSRSPDVSSYKQDDHPSDGTLTRKTPDSSLQEPEETYVSMTLAQHPPTKPQALSHQESYESMSSVTVFSRNNGDSDNDEGSFQQSQYTCMEEIQPHCYVNHTPIATPPPTNDLVRISSDSKLVEHHYQNVMDRTTKEKLLNNVRILMDTVTQQSADISTLKKTVKDLKMRVEELEHQLEADY